MARTRSTKASVAAYVLCAELSGRVDLGEKQVLSARGFKRVGRHPAYSIYTV